MFFLLLLLNNDKIYLQLQLYPEDNFEKDLMYQRRKVLRKAILIYICNYSALKGHSIELTPSQIVSSGKG